MESKRKSSVLSGILALSGILLLAALWFGNGLKVQAQEIAISDTTVILYLSDGVSEKQLTVSGAPKTAEITYRSKSPSIASVGKSSGVITAKGAGKTTIICTVTLENGDKKELKTTVRVRDNIREIKLSAGEGVQPNALRLSTDYKLSYTCKTKAGTNKNTSNSLYYEVVAPKGDISPNAFVTDGVFRASKCGTYLVNVYVFQTNSEKNKWLSDRKKYKDNVLAFDTLELTVTIKKFKTKTVTKYGWSMELPPSFEISATQEKDGGVQYSIQARTKDKLPAMSNIQVVVDPLKETGELPDLEYTLETVYTEEMLLESWKKAYSAKSAKVSQLSMELVDIGQKTVVKLHYNIELKDIKLVQKASADIEIDRLVFYNTLYTWYEKKQHVTVNVTDAGEAIQPNISEAAEKMVESMMPSK